MDFLAQISPFALLLLAEVFTWTATSLGSAVVFCFRNINKSALDIMLGISGGIMMAAAIWSLILPAGTLAEEIWGNQWLSLGLGILSGGLFIIICALILNHLTKDNAEAVTKRHKILTAGAITLHNIPEGMAVGVGFSSFALGNCSLIGALAIAFGIGIQNFPDGIAVSVPLYRHGTSKKKAFFLGQASGLVEPLAAILGYWTTVAIRGILPYLLAFAAGAMMAVVVNELLPDIAPENRLWATLGFIGGFILLMVLNLAIMI